MEPLTLEEFYNSIKQPEDPSFAALSETQKDRIRKSPAAKLANFERQVEIVHYRYREELEKSLHAMKRGMQGLS